MNELGETLTQTILSTTGASAITGQELIQNLWSGYGQIIRLTLAGGTHPTVIIKHVQTDTQSEHPRGWNTDLSHQRKLRSYQIEASWYQNWSEQYDEQCRTPKLIGGSEYEGELLLILEDLDASGYPLRLQSLNWSQVESCLAWLANFHVTSLGKTPTDLWEVGTYWHLATRPDELAALTDCSLQAAAPAIDKKLSSARYQTLVHGDAKLANFCFSLDGSQVAALDFQYIGGGCGMKDVAYFLGSCLDEATCEAREDELLNLYFHHFTRALAIHHPEVDASAVVTEWRDLYPFAWADFHRFLKNWSPDHWKLNSYSEKMVRKAMASLEREST